MSDDLTTALATLRATATELLVAVVREEPWKIPPTWDTDPRALALEMNRLNADLARRNVLLECAARALALDLGDLRGTAALAGSLERLTAYPRLADLTRDVRRYADALVVADLTKAASRPPEDTDHA